MIRATGPGQFLVLIPAYNEQDAIGFVVGEVKDRAGDVPVLVVDDCSTDSTAPLAKLAGAEVLSLPFHLGLGGTVQAGYRLAYDLGYDFVVRIDGDGQHDPAHIPEIITALKASGCQMVIGSRFANGNAHPHSSLLRALGTRFFRLVLRPILGKQVHDPTSGYVGVNRQALDVFSRSFPLEYPEIEALVVLQRRAFQFMEIPVRMRPRRGGRSTITPLKSVYYILHVLLGVLVNVLRFERGRWR